MLPPTASTTRQLYMLSYRESKDSSSNVPKGKRMQAVLQAYVITGRAGLGWAGPGPRGGGKKSSPDRIERERREGGRRVNDKVNSCQLCQAAKDTNTCSGMCPNPLLLRRPDRVRQLQIGPLCSIHQRTRLSMPVSLYHLLIF